MLKQLSIMASIMLALSASPTFAQASKPVKLLGTHGDWGTYRYDSQKGKVCYVLSEATKKQPSSLDHGKIYFLISQKPGQGVSFEPQFAASYKLQDKSKVVVSVGSNSFSLFTDGKSAWLENAAEEPQLIQRMKAGASMSVKAKSGRGNQTSYEFSLKGITKALESISSCN